jgi:hypothetical protein
MTGKQRTRPVFLHGGGAPMSIEVFGQFFKDHGCDSDRQTMGHCHCGGLTIVTCSVCGDLVLAWGDCEHAAELEQLIAEEYD